MRASYEGSPRLSVARQAITHLTPVSLFLEFLPFLWNSYLLPCIAWDLECSTL